LATRFDFQGRCGRPRSSLKDKDITLIRRRRLPTPARCEDILASKQAERDVDVRFLDDGDRRRKVGGDKVKQVVKVRNGIEAEASKKIQRLIKDSKIKVQAAIQGDAVRVTGAKRDDLQAAMALIRKDIARPAAELQQLPRLTRLPAAGCMP